MELFIFVDVSGSMNEMGKIHLQRNLCRYAAQLRLIDQEKYSGLDIRFYQWAQNVAVAVLQSDGDIPALNAEGSSNLCVISDFLFQYQSDTGRLMVLILSDGNFPNSDIVSFQKQLGTFSNLIIRTVAVGADADLLKLKKISTNNTVYLSENIASAVDSTIFGSDELLTAPVSTARILESAQTEIEEPGRIGMLDRLWNSWGASVIGPLHVKAGIPNQDSWMARRYKWGNVVVVSDGLGSKAHSDHGSKAACLAVFEAAKSYQNTPDANIVDILRLIHANWLVKIAPYSSTDCSATCLFAIQIEGIITLGRLGDGMIAALGETGENHLILSDNKQDSFSNYTNSLQQEFKPEQWETATIESAACNAVVLCTDGISDDLLPEKQMTFAQELYSTYADLESEERKRDLKRWLNEWPVPGHSDDKTIACLFKKGGSQ